MAIQIDNRAKAIMLFSQISNINFGYSALSEKDLETNSCRIKDIIEYTSDNIVSNKLQELWQCDWEIAWGPVLNYSKNSKDGSYHVNNSLYVVKGKDSVSNKNVYVVAIAGTNKLSDFELFFEDIAVKTVVSWNKSKLAQGKISNGSMTGLNKVLGKFDYGANDTLMDFFNAEVKKHGAENIEIITCGHSLGGALSPLTALKIKETYPNISVSTYPTAGPTSGDATFAKYLETTLGEGNYISVINTNDIVPMAWEHETVTEIPNIYNRPECGNITMNDKMKNELMTISSKITEYNYTRIAKEQEYCFTGSLTVPKCPENKNDCDLFMVEAMYQHSVPYDAEFFKDEEEFVKVFREIVYEDGRKK